MTTNERLELVTSFESLRADDDVVILACDCGLPFCRSRLTTLHPGAGLLGPGWFTAPQCRHRDSGAVLIVGEAAVRSGCLFRVVATSGQEAPREVVRGWVSDEWKAEALAQGAGHEVPTFDREALQRDVDEISK
jgi:hypothetical protein